MFAVEFQTNVKDGTIEIPTEYRESFKDRVRVILLAEVGLQTKQPLHAVQTFIHELLQKPIQLENFHPFSRDEIYAR